MTFARRLEGRMFKEGEFVDTVIADSRSEIVMLRPHDGGVGVELSTRRDCGRARTRRDMAVDSAVGTATHATSTNACKRCRPPTPFAGGAYS